MSYSRWGNSVWYTYADVSGGFTICDVINFSEQKLRKDIEGCINEVRELTDYATDENLKELREYMQDYLDNEAHDKMETHSP